MLIDVIIQFLIFYGHIVISFICLLKIALLVWYKPKRFKFYRRSFLRLYTGSMISSRDISHEKWEKFRIIHNYLTLFLFSFGTIYVLLLLLLRNINK